MKLGRRTRKVSPECRTNQTPSPLPRSRISDTVSARLSSKKRPVVLRASYVAAQNEPISVTPSEKGTRLFPDGVVADAFALASVTFTCSPHWKEPSAQRQPPESGAGTCSTPRAQPSGRTRASGSRAQGHARRSSQTPEGHTKAHASGFP